MRTILRDYKTSLIALLLAAVVLLAAAYFLPESTSSQSPELGVASLSPKGAAGGAVIPASCGSPHSGDMCTPPTVSCLPTSVNQGGSSTCTWSCPSRQTSAGIGFSTGGANSGSTEFNPPSSGDYGAQCSGGGQTTVTITVYSPNLTLTATPGRVRSGNSASITWSASAVTGCALKNPSGGTIGTGLSGTVAQTITQESTYTLTCTTTAGDTSKSVTIGIIPSIEPF